MYATRLERLKEQVAVGPLTSGVADGRRNTTVRAVFCLYIVEEEIDELALLPGWPRGDRAIERAERLLDVLVERLVEAELLRPDDQDGTFVACQR